MASEEEVNISRLGGVNRRESSRLEAMSKTECASRQSARTALYERANRMRREADRLTALADSLPGLLLPEADEALWNLVMSCRA